MRISDWSSDVCSSDLQPLGHCQCNAVSVKLADERKCHVYPGCNTSGCDQATIADVDGISFDVCLGEHGRQFACVLPVCRDATLFEQYCMGQGKGAGAVRTVETGMACSSLQPRVALKVRSRLWQCRSPTDAHEIRKDEHTAEPQ